ncbi:MAG: hypothetical protein ACI9NN_001242 [Bacteroidia bacterium]|jgi:hypothetical protein
MKKFKRWISAVAAMAFSTFLQAQSLSQWKVNLPSLLLKEYGVTLEKQVDTTQSFSVGFSRYKPNRTDQKRIITNSYSCEYRMYFKSRMPEVRLFFGPYAKILYVSYRELNDNGILSHTSSVDQSEMVLGINGGLRWNFLQRASLELCLGLGKRWRDPQPFDMPDDKQLSYHALRNVTFFYHQDLDPRFQINLGYRFCK